MGSLARTLSNVFWASVMVIFLLIVGFFVLRVIGRLGQGTFISGLAGKIGAAATPQG